MKERYIQLMRAEQWREKDLSVPTYDFKRNIYCYKDDVVHEDKSLEKLAQSFVNYELKFRYILDNYVVTRHTFSEVLKDMLVYFRSMKFDGYEKDYNEQQLEFLKMVREKMLEVKK